MGAPGAGVGSGGANPNSSKGIDLSHANAADIIAASYFDRGVVGDDIYRDLAGNNIRCLKVAQLQSYLASAAPDASGRSGDTLSHQGYTTDGTWHYTFDTDQIYKHTDDATWPSGGAGPDSADTHLPATIFNNLEPTTDHIGDGQYYNSQLIVTASNGRSTAPFLSQIVIFDVSLGLPYDHHVKIVNDSGELYGSAGCTYNPDTDEVFVPNFYGDYNKVFVYTLTAIKAASAGDTLSPSRTITLNFPSYQTQGLFYRNGELWLSQNEGDIFVYDLSGRFSRSYMADGNSAEFGGSAGGNQGIDYSQDELRLVKSNAANQGAGFYFDIDSIPAKSATHTNGERIEHAHCLRLVFDSTFSAMDWPDAGTIITRIKVRSADTRMWMSPRSSIDDFIGRTLDGAFPVKLAAWMNTLSGLTSADNNAQNTWIDVTFTWDKTGGAVSDGQATLTVNGVQTIGADDAWVTTTPKDIGIGVLHEAKGAVGDTTQPDHDCLYWYMYDTVKTLTEINAIHADPTGMIKD